jgi:hypothetical protein
MGFFDLFKSTSPSSSGKSIRKNYVGNMIHLTFPTSKGDFIVKANSVSGPGGAKGVMYDCFIVALGQWQQQGMGEGDFIHDMEKVVNLVADGNNNKTVMETLLKRHIAQSGRLIDTDLCTYISELYLALIAINGSCNRNELLDQMMQVAERGFGNKLFITQYRRSAYGIQPYLVSFADFSRNR